MRWHRSFARGLADLAGDLVREFPEMRRELLAAKVFLRHRSAAFDLAVLAALLLAAAAPGRPRAAAPLRPHPAPDLARRRPARGRRSHQLRRGRPSRAGRRKPARPDGGAVNAKSWPARLSGPRSEREDDARRAVCAARRARRSSPACAPQAAWKRSTVDLDIAADAYHRPGHPRPARSGYAFPAAHRSPAPSSTAAAGSTCAAAPSPSAKAACCARASC